MRKLLCIAISVCLFIVACTKIESTGIGSGLVGTIDGVTTIDTTLDVYTSTLLDPLADSERILKSDDYVIGVIKNDPVFGKTTATAFFELKPTYYKYSLKGKIAERRNDSAVLVLSYRSTWGDNNLPQTWEVRELDETIASDSSYTITKNFATKGSVLGSKLIDVPRLADSVNVTFEKSKNQVRIKLNQAFADRLIKQYDSLATNDPYVSDSLFRLNFKGFAVAPAAGSNGNALIRVNLADTNTKLALYYDYKETDTSAFAHTVDFFRFYTGTSAIKARSGSANYIQRDRSGSEVQNNLNNPAADSAIYIQTSPGTYATVRIPGLSNLPNMMVHRAELVAFQLPEASGLHNTFTAPQLLFLSAFDSVRNLEKNIPNDFFLTQGIYPNFSSFGGGPANRDVSPYGTVQAYIFDLSRYVQGIVTRKETNYTLRLSAPVYDSVKYTEPYPLTTAERTYVLNPSVTNPHAVGRVRLGSGSLSVGNPLRMRLRIVYSKI